MKLVRNGKASYMVQGANPDGSVALKQFATRGDLIKWLRAADLVGVDVSGYTVLKTFPVAVNK